MVSFQTLDRRRTSGIGNGFAFHSTLATAALVSVCVGVLSAAILLDVSIAPVFSRAAAVEGSRARVPAAAALPKNVLRVTLEVIAFTSCISVSLIRSMLLSISLTKSELWLICKFNLKILKAGERLKESAASQPCSSRDGESASQQKQLR
jgi:hypothetical protein